MSDPTHQRRVYGDKEIAEILERATDLQRSEASPSPRTGMTLAELEDIAREAGIDVRHLRRAAKEVDSGAAEPTGWTNVLGETVVLAREATLPGEITEHDFEDLLGVIQGSVSDHGQPSLLGRTLTWQGGGADNLRKLRVVVSSRDGETQIRVEENLSQTAGALFGGVLGGVGMGVGLGVGLPLGISLGSGAVAVALPAAWLALTWVGVRRVFRGVVTRRRVSIGELFDRLVDQVNGAITRSTLEAD